VLWRGDGFFVFYFIIRNKQFSLLIIRVADPGCLSRIPDPDFYPSRISDPGSRISDPGSRIPEPGSRIPEPDLGSRIPDPKTATKEKGEKNFCPTIFFVAMIITKLKIILFLNW
jgi:hypothetical protein